MPYSTQPYIVVAAMHEDVPTIRAAFERSPITAKTRYLDDGSKLINYLQGNGKYANRSEYPVPDFVLVDLKLPGRSGFEVLEAIADQDAARRPRVIVLANAENLREVNEAYRVGATSFLMKPIDPEDFRNTMLAVQEDWMRRKQTS